MIAENAPQSVTHREKNYRAQFNHTGTVAHSNVDYADNEGYQVDRQGIAGCVHTICLGRYRPGFNCSASLVGWHYQQVRTSVAWLDEHDASYEWHYQVPHLERLPLQRLQAKLAPVVGQAIVSDIHTVTLNEPSLNDDDLSQLSRLMNLNNLTLVSHQATDETLARVADLKQLRSIAISGRRFTFEGLLELRKLPRLRYLNLSDMQLSMAELAVLESAVPLANLKYTKSEHHAPYERQVVGRYPRVQKKEPVSEVGFEPLIGRDAQVIEGLPVRVIDGKPEVMQAS